MASPSLMKVTDCTDCESNKEKAHWQSEPNLKSSTHDKNFDKRAEHELEEENENQQNWSILKLSHNFEKATGMKL